MTDCHSSCSAGTSDVFSIFARPRPSSDTVGAVLGTLPRILGENSTNKNLILIGDSRCENCGGPKTSAGQAEPPSERMSSGVCVLATPVDNADNFDRALGSLDIPLSSACWLIIDEPGAVDLVTSMMKGAQTGMHYDDHRRRATTTGAANPGLPGATFTSAHVTKHVGDGGLSATVTVDDHTENGSADTLRAINTIMSTLWAKGVEVTAVVGVDTLRAGQLFAVMSFDGGGHFDTGSVGHGEALKSWFSDLRASTDPSLPNSDAASIFEADESVLPFPPEAGNEIAEEAQLSDIYIREFISHFTDRPDVDSDLNMDSESPRGEYTVCPWETGRRFNPAFGSDERLDSSALMSLCLDSFRDFITLTGEIADDIAASASSEGQQPDFSDPVVAQRWIRALNTGSLRDISHGLRYSPLRHTLRDIFLSAAQAFPSQSRSFALCMWGIMDRNEHESLAGVAYRRALQEQKFDEGASLPYSLLALHRGQKTDSGIALLTALSVESLDDLVTTIDALDTQGVDVTSERKTISTLLGATDFDAIIDEFRKFRFEPWASTLSEGVQAARRLQRWGHDPAEDNAKARRE
ncbi:hypothetical protein [Corynebacterium sp.]|uniref:hypothetical protein n=1 Tax=Corynebacterium sp. TaxID=1720 RepID=UPI0026DC2878|nr:hypothetical protein [Corynebacterium sp.]MDO4914161.1 hypothetical protein [Corynebacterium sp.]